MHSAAIQYLSVGINISFDHSPAVKLLAATPSKHVIGSCLGPSDPFVLLSESCWRFGVTTLLNYALVPDTLEASDTHNVRSRQGQAREGIMIPDTIMSLSHTYHTYVYLIVLYRPMPPSHIAKS